MSIYICGMEMPTSCRTCHLKMNCDECEGWECVCVPLHQQIGYLDDLLTDKRRDDCPLVPVPPHGDLIDRKALLADTNDMLHSMMVFGGARVYTSGAIKNAPTIIEAEEGERCQTTLSEKQFLNCFENGPMDIATSK